jgi:hypothetical protein
MSCKFYITSFFIAAILSASAPPGQAIAQSVAPAITPAPVTTPTMPTPTTPVTVTFSDYYLALDDANDAIDLRNNHVLAILGSRVITSYDLIVESAVRTVRIKGYDAWLVGAEAMPHNKLLDITINQQLVAQEAEQFREARLQSMQVERKLLSQALKDLWDRFPDLDARDLFLKRTGISVVSITNMLIREIIVDSYLKEKLSRSVSVSSLSTMIEMARNPGKYKSTAQAHEAVLARQLKRQERSFVRNLRKKTEIRILIPHMQ